MDVETLEPQVLVAPHGARQQAGLQQHLETVADAQHQTAGLGVPLDGAHHRRQGGERSGAQVVAVREAARQHDQLTALEGIVLVPEELGLLLQHVFPDVVDVVVAVAAGKDDDAALHGRAPTSPSSSTE